MIGREVLRLQTTCVSAAENVGEREKKRGRKRATRDDGQRRSPSRRRRAEGWSDSDERNNTKVNKLK